MKKKSKSKVSYLFNFFQADPKNSALIQSKIILEVYSDHLGNLATMDAEAAKNALDALYKAYLDSPESHNQKEAATVKSFVLRLDELLDYIHSSEDDKAFQF